MWRKLSVGNVRDGLGTYRGRAKTTPHIPTWQGEGVCGMVRVGALASGRVVAPGELAGPVCQCELDSFP
jgi:hypothetical protein